MLLYSEAIPDPVLSLIWTIETLVAVAIATRKAFYWRLLSKTGVTLVLLIRPILTISSLMQSIGCLLYYQHHYSCNLVFLSDHRRTTSSSWKSVFWRATCRAYRERIKWNTYCTCNSTHNLRSYIHNCNLHLGSHPSPFPAECWIHAPTAGLTLHAGEDPLHTRNTPATSTLYWFQ